MNYIKQLIIIYQLLLQRFFGFAKSIFKKLDGVTAKYYFRTKTQKRIALVIVVFLGLLLFINPVRAAAVDEWVIANVLLPVLSAIISILGIVLSFLVWILVKVAQYNGFIDAQVVVIGWKLVRDVCNMFFIIVLLVIAFGTVLGIQNYSYKNLLKKLIIMVLLINFSLTITAFFIDFSQIIMLTFVAAFKGAARNFTTIFGLTEILNFNYNNSTAKADYWSLLGAAIIGLVLVIVCCIVVIIFLLVLLVRIMYLWLLMVLSPLAYFLSTFPSGQQHAAKWWKTFSEQLIIGPLLAFFLWLALASAQGTGKISLAKVDINNDEITEFAVPAQTPGKETPTNPFLTGAAQPNGMLSVITGVCLLIVGLMLAQEMGGAAGKIAGKGLAKLQGIGTGQIGPTPMRWGRERLEARKKMKEDMRKQKAAAGGAKLIGLEGRVRGAATAPIRGISKLAQKFTDKRADAEGFAKGMKDKSQGLKDIANEKQNEAQGLKDKAAQLRIEGKGEEADKLQNEALKLDKKASDLIKKGLEIDKDAEKIVKRYGEGSKSGWRVTTGLAVPSKRYWDKRADATNAIAGKKRDEGNVSEADRLEKKAKRYRMVGQVARAVTTGVGVAALPMMTVGTVMAGGVLGAKFLNYQGKKQKQTGEELQYRAKNYKSAEIDKERKNFKDKDINEIIRTSEDISAPAFTRMAAILERLERGGYKANEVGKAKADLVQLGADELTLSNFTQMLQIKFPQAVDPMTGRPRDTRKMIDDMKDEIVDPTKINKSGYESHDHEGAYAVCAGATDPQFNNIMGIPSKRKELAKSSGKSLEKRQLRGELADLKYGDITTMPDGDEKKAEQRRREENSNVISRHFAAAGVVDNNGQKIFEMSDDGGTVGNSKLVQDVLKRKKEALNVISNIDFTKFKENNAGSLISQIVENSDPSVILKALSEVAADGNEKQKASMEAFLDSLHSMESQQGQPSSQYTELTKRMKGLATKPTSPFRQNYKHSSHWAPKP